MAKASWSPVPTVGLKSKKLQDTRGFVECQRRKGLPTKKISRLSVNNVEKFWLTNSNWPDTFKLLTARPDISNVSSVTIKTTEAIT